MRRIVIFGNSGSGKSTLAGELSSSIGCSHLDLDTIAWEEGVHPPTRRSIADSDQALAPFLTANAHWVIEGCYADLLALVIPRATHVFFLNPGVETCIQNCKNRPWEPHKYPSPEAQNANLKMLIDWIRLYEQREDEFSLAAHRALFQAFSGDKREITSNDRSDISSLF